MLFDEVDVNFTASGNFDNNSLQEGMWLHSTERSVPTFSLG